MSQVTAAFTLFVALGACRSTQAPPAAPAAAPTDLRYAIELASLEPPQIHVELRVTADPSGTSVFAVAPSFGSSGSIAELIHGLAVRDASGAELALEKLDERRWSVAAEPGSELALSWNLDPLPPKTREDHGNDYRPIVTPQWFHTIGDSAFVWPEWMENGDPRSFEVAWRGFDRAGWKVACSFGADQRRVRTERALPEFRSSVFLAGPLRLHERKLGDTTLCCALLGDNWKFRDEQLVELAERVVASERAFFDDPGPPFYLVSLLPTPAMAEGSFSLGGTALTNSFAMFVMDGIALEPGSDSARRVAHLLAHEHMHTWTGRTISPTDPEELAYWFTEGFTEFYTGRLLLAAGLITPEQRVETLNQTIASHWRSPARNAPNARIREAFWSDGDIQKLPYSRGELVALRLDHEIRRASKGERSLDDFVRELLVDARAPNGGQRRRFSTEELLERAARWTSPAVAEDLRRAIVDGEDLALPADTWSEWVALETRASAQFALGFDREATFESGRVCGVVDGSAAWDAGLRNGQRVKALRMNGGDADSPVSLTIREDAVDRELQWLPRGDALDVPAFRLVKAGAF